MDNCIFCKIVAGQAPAYKIAENDDAIAILDIFPIRKGQAVVISKKHVSSNFSHADIDTIHTVMSLAHETAQKMEKGLGYDRSFIEIQGLGVSHFHVKIYPKYANDTERFTIYQPDDMEKADVLQDQLDRITQA